ncbi:hypothetical protein RF11_03404 [Thelohanellus kitauei]|uniref:Uncharacterized protein n=1 Tax=Thelohanellus kitauei TaxID=669202 RepID=A0A0C2IHJ7_THEKT|nr:hypothetical protein RF11_03404 [Thelohanellus kitauei]
MMRLIFSNVLWLLIISVSNIYAQKQKYVDVEELNVVVVGNIGVSEYDSGVKIWVGNSIKKLNAEKPFQLGINLGNNFLPYGSRTNDFKKLDEVFTSTFPSSLFPFDFLTVLGNEDHKSNFYTLIQYHFQKDERFYLPKRNYVYG